MNYKYNSKSSLNFISLHDTIIQDLRVIGNDLYLYVNMINMTPDVVENSFDVAKQTDEALIVLSEFKIEEYTRNYGDKFDSKSFKNPKVDDIKRLIKYGKSYIYDFDPVENDELYRELLFDPLEDCLISVMVSYKESTMYWDEFEKDAWWVGFEKKKTGKLFNKLKAIHSYEKSYMKDYEYKYSYYFLAPFAFMFIIGPLIALAFSIPMGINGSEYYLVPVLIWGGILLTMCAVLIPYTLYVKKKDRRPTICN